jgi:DNA-binding response OmpR family regulator
MVEISVVPIAEVPVPVDVEKPRPVVLVVDDERLIAETLSIILSGSGFAAMPAYDGESALEIAKVIPPHVLLTDIVMPGMTGIELAIALREKIADCRVLLFSGQSSTIDLLAEARAAGHEFAMLTKPVPPAELIACIKGCMQADVPSTVFMPTSADNDDLDLAFERIAI